MTRPLILVAASGLAREVLEVVSGVGSYEPIGFVDDDAALWGTVVHGVEVIGGLGTLTDHPDAAVLLCAGDGAARASLAARLDLDDARYATVVDPSVAVPRSCRLGSGAVVMAGCVLTASVTVGRHVVLMPHVTLTHDDRVADCATLCAGVALGGGVVVGERAYLGMNASVREQRRLGRGAVIGMGAVVLTDVPDGETWVGVPARRLAGRRPINELVGANGLRESGGNRR